MNPKYLYVTKIYLMMFGITCLTTYYLLDMPLLTQDVGVCYFCYLEHDSLLFLSAEYDLSLSLEAIYSQHPPDSSAILPCVHVPTNTSYSGSGSFPLLVFTYSWQRFWMRKRETLHSLQLIHELWKKRIVHCGTKGIWNK